MLRDFEPRLYQKSILETVLKGNTLVILPTGLGKTAIAMMLADNRLSNFPSSKIIFLAPSRPLAAQHLETFKAHLDIEDNKFALFTGTTSPESRHKLWKDARLIFGTPQGITNDIINNKISLEDVSCLILDEIQHATGDYDYVWLCKQYNNTAKFPKILGLTASPGSDTEKITEICKNAFIEHIEIRTDSDEDVKPYIKEKDIEYILVDLPEDFKKIQAFLKDCFTSKLEKIKGSGYIDSVKYTSKTELLRLQKDLHRRILSGEKNYALWHCISSLAEALKAEHALTLLETQGINSAYNYIKKLHDESETTKVKATKNLVKDLNFRSAYLLTQQLVLKDVEHPKVLELKNIIAKEIKDDYKIIVFNNYRDSASQLVDKLNKINNVKAGLFVGQTKKGGTGMSQKNQLKLLEEFKGGLHNVIVCTSVGEEGIDISAVDHVIFYEPVPSAIRTIQRRGRTGRQSEGRGTVLVTKNTRDEISRWVAHHKEKRMYRLLHNLKSRLQLAPEKQHTLETFSKQKPTVFIDSREKNSTIAKELKNLNIPVEIKQLASADYIVSNIGIELKTREDFIASIIDQRLLSQVRSLKENFEKQLILIQGDEDLYSIRNVHPNAIRGMLAAIAINYNIPIIYTKNPLDTAALLATIVKREEERGDKEPLFGERKPLTTKELQEHIVASFPGVGNVVAKSLLTELKSIRAIVNAEESMLREIDNIGPKKAREIKRIIDEEYG